MIGGSMGGFEGGLSAQRLKTFAANRAHVNTLIQAAGADMTARARYLIRNNGCAANAVESWAGNAVGTGIKNWSIFVRHQHVGQVTQRSGAGYAKSLHQRS